MNNWHAHSFSAHLTPLIIMVVDLLKGLGLVGFLTLTILPASMYLRAALDGPAAV